MKLTGRVLYLLAVSLASLSASRLAQAKDLSFLFLGNSYTYFEGQGQPDAPVLPKTIKGIAESIDPTIHLNYAFNTPGGWSFEKHFNDPVSVKLMQAHYDEVILQGQSIESLELTPWWEANGNPGVKSFGVYLPKVLDLVFKESSSVTLYVNWGYNPKNTLLQENQPGLYFPAGTPKAGERWCGKDKFDYQKMIDESYALHSQGYPVKFAWVGDAWLSLQTAGWVTQDELYLEGDWSHPSVLGGFVTALVFVRDVLHQDILKNQYFPEGIDPARAQGLERFLSRNF
jgi:hypothetical protein